MRGKKKTIAQYFGFYLYIGFLAVGFPNLAKAESVRSGKLYVFCQTNGVLKLFSPVGLRSYFGDELAFSKKFPNLYSIAEEIDGDKLVQYDRPDNDEHALRTGSKVIKKTCASLNVEIQTGYFNSNPQAMNGGEDNYPVIRILYGKTVLVDKIKLGYCEAGQPFYLDCPDNWASRIFVNPMNPKNIDIEIIRNYSERKKIIISK